VLDRLAHLFDRNANILCSPLELEALEQHTALLRRLQDGHGAIALLSAAGEQPERPKREHPAESKKEPS
jgi:hypothetical protein